MISPFCRDHLHAMQPGRISPGEIRRMNEIVPGKLAMEQIIQVLIGIGSSLVRGKSKTR